MSDLDLSMLDLFREEARSQSATLGQGLLALESDPGDARKIEPLMRAAHSLKRAARIVGFDGAVGLAHSMEEALVAAQHGRIRLTRGTSTSCCKGATSSADSPRSATPRSPAGGRATPPWPPSSTSSACGARSSIAS